jgi:hypothetical protein
MDRTTVGDRALRFGKSFGDGRRQTSSNHAGIGKAAQIVEMRYLTHFWFRSGRYRLETKMRQTKLAI